MFQIKRMRIGNSKLNKHMRGGLSRRCRLCDRDVDETIDHFFLECTKYKNDRSVLKNNITNDLKRLKLDFNSKNLLEMNRKIMSSKKKKLSYYIKKK